MGAILKYKLSPAVFGIVSCVLLVSSWGVSRILQMLDDEKNAASLSLQFVRKMEIINFILVFVSLCFCVHFVRGTAQLFDKHVWEVPQLVVLMCMPVFNLSVTVLSLISPRSELLSNYLFSVLFIFFSMPAFFCYYFIFICMKFKGSRLFRYSTIFLFIAGAVYLVLRLCDNVIFPLIERSSAFEPLPALRALASYSSIVSVAVYVFTVFSFAVFGKLLFDAALSQTPAEPTVREEASPAEK